ncbi:MAG: hypothetical protein LBS41_03990 [Streptococcaceae bacterium]|jgi:hypothetical protein|nr:hypothetical protein [Streptococcaceae bacterium]
MTNRQTKQRTNHGKKVRGRAASVKGYLKIGLAILIVAGLARGAHLLIQGGNQPAAKPTSTPKTSQSVPASKKEKTAGKRQTLLAQAERHAKQYDYEAAIKQLQDPVFAHDSEATDKIEAYKTAQSQLVRHEDVTDITHVFFHSLIVDPALAFNPPANVDGYNDYMTTVTEFKRMLKAFYAGGFVLVSPHDMVKKVTAADGTETFTAGDILLPEGKKPMVMSQDDVNYYKNMTGFGFADKLVVDKDGAVKAEYIDPKTKKTSVGAYDLVPILDAFIEEHPEFSYHNHKAVICETGYEGALGYHDVKTTGSADFKAAKAVADAMKADGYEFASHFLCPYRLRCGNGSSSPR